MNAGQRQVIAEKIASTVRVLELLGFEYEVTGPRFQREKGNASPRVVRVHTPDGELRIYNNKRGATWANLEGIPVRNIVVVEDLYLFLKDVRAGTASKWTRRKTTRTRVKAAAKAKR